MKKAKLTFAGGAGGPTGANFLFEIADKKILIDCGLTQGGEKDEETNREPFAYDPASIDALFVTHAHLDHIGRIPILVKNGFRGRIYSTPPTRDIVELTFADALSIMDHESRQKQKEPLYNSDDVRETLSLWEGVKYGQSIAVSDDLNIICLLYTSPSPRDS